MTAVAEVMSRHVHTIGPQESLQRAAQMMQGLDVGSLPVSDGERLLGIVTDRDITVRGVAAGLGPDSACVSDVMSADVACCTPDQDSREAMDLMGQRQIRRLPVVDSARRLVGMVALADLALRQDAHIDDTVREISTPAAGSPSERAPALHGDSPAERLPQKGVAME